MDVCIKSNDKILIVSPHADDESIGCGGLLAMFGSQCDLILVTDGRHGHTAKQFSDEADLIRLRKKEFENAAKIAGVKKIKYLNIEDGKTFQNKGVIYGQSIREYDYVFVPNSNESHKDHRVLVSTFKHMKKVQHSRCTIMEYEVWTPLIHPTWFLDITSVSETKKEMISQYCSQIADIDYVSMGMALSRYRGTFINTEYAEAFMHNEYSGFKKLVYNSIPENYKQKIKELLNRRKS